MPKSRDVKFTSLPSLGQNSAEADFRRVPNPRALKTHKSKTARSIRRHPQVHLYDANTRA